MSGWIKWEKDLETDPRFLRMVRDMKRTCNASAYQHQMIVTLVCGALTRLWSYADSHLRDDDTLDMGASELDELLGIENFCSIVPDDWLMEVNENTVKLPNFQSHNGVEAKKKALTQKRVESHRKRTSVTPALPDQTRPDQTKTRPEEKKDTSASPPAINGTCLEFDELKRVYPKRGGDQGWAEALRRCSAHLKRGTGWSEILEGAARYAHYCRETNSEGTQFVKSAVVFCGPDKHFEKPWIPPLTKGEVVRDQNIDASLQWLEQQEQQDEIRRQS